MLSINSEDKRVQVEMYSIDQLVPEDHLVRKIEAAIDFDFIYGIVKDKYSLDKGHPRLEPVVLMKLVLIQYIFGIKSMRQTIKEIERSYQDVIFQLTEKLNLTQYLFLKERS